MSISDATSTDNRNIPPELPLPERNSAAFRDGIKATFPTLFGVAAWGMVVGIAMIKAHLSLTQALAMTMLVFAGSAQLASLPLIAAHAPVWMIFVTALVVNLRFVIFSAVMAPHFIHLKWRKRLLLGFWCGDLSTGLFLQRYPDEKPAPEKASYLTGLLIPNWLAWEIGSIAGIFLGHQIPEQWGLGFAGTLAILCITVPLVANRAALCGVAMAGAMALAGASWPYKLGLLAAVIAGMITALAMDEWSERRSP